MKKILLLSLLLMIVGTSFGAQVAQSLISPSHSDKEIDALLDELTADVHPILKAYYGNDACANEHAAIKRLTALVASGENIHAKFNSPIPSKAGAGPLWFSLEELARYENKMNVVRWVAMEKSPVLKAYWGNDYCADQQAAIKRLAALEGALKALEGALKWQEKIHEGKDIFELALKEKKYDIVRWLAQQKKVAVNPILLAYWGDDLCADQQAAIKRLAAERSFVDWRQGIYTVDWQAKIYKNKNLLELAFEEKKAAIALWLVQQKKITIKIDNNKLTIAARNGNAEEMKFWIAVGADVNAFDSFGSTALMWAAYNGSVEIVKILIAAKADVNISQKDGFTTALQMALMKNHKEVIKILIAAGAKDKKRVDEKLISAAHGGNAEDVKLWIVAGADVNAFDSSGSTALMWASWKGYVEIAKILIAAGADVNIQTKDAWSSTALRLAALQNHIEVTKILVQAGADLNGLPYFLSPEIRDFLQKAPAQSGKEVKAKAAAATTQIRAKL